MFIYIMYSIFYVVMWMKIESYKQLVRVVTATMGFIVALSVVLNNILLLLAAITMGMLIIYLAKRQVAEKDRDERTAIINQKASQATLSITVITLAISGLILILLSRQGYLNYEQVGFQLSVVGLLIMSLKAFFDWYYRNQYGG